MSKTEIILKPASHGDYYIFHIPNKLIKNNLIDPNKTYCVTLEPINEDKKEQGEN